MILTSKFNTPLGEMIAGATGEGLCLLDFTESKRYMRIIDDLGRILKTGIQEGENIHIQDTIIQLDEYFKGKRKEFNIPLAMIGTEFQKEVWKGLLDIPFGIKRTYSYQAATHGGKKFIRAVARANGMNPVCIIIPCHRVIGSDGSLTGYSGGLERKKWLLVHESKNAIISIGELEFES